MNCLDIRTLATEYLEIALPPKDHTAFERHLKVCEKCQEWFETLKETIEALGQLPNEELSAVTEKILLEQFRKSKPNRPLHLQKLDIEVED